MIGSPFAEDTKKPMQPAGTFLGLTHDLASVNSTGHVKFWARSRLHDKVKDILAASRAANKFTRGTASKLYGIANFLEQGIYGRVGYGGLMAIKAKQGETTTALTALTSEIEACFEVIEAVMRLEPRREFPSSKPSKLDFRQPRMQLSRLTIQVSSGGFHLVFFQPESFQNRLSFVAAKCAELQALGQPATTHITQ